MLRILKPNINIYNVHTIIFTFFPNILFLFVPFKNISIHTRIAKMFKGI